MSENETLPPIIVEGNTYDFTAKLKFNADNTQIGSEKLGRHAQRDLNQSQVYFDLARRGIGIIPETPAGNTQGQKAFYARRELKGDAENIFNWLADNYSDQFSSPLFGHADAIEPSEIPTLVDTAIAQLELRPKLEELGLA